MAYPLNPPAMPYFTREWLTKLDVKPIDKGLWKDKSGWWWWEPPWREEKNDQDWIVGPYRLERSARRAQQEFVDTMGEGPELRTWEI